MRLCGGDQLAARHAVTLDESRGREPGCRSAFIQDESRLLYEETSDRGAPAAQGATVRPCVTTQRKEPNTNQLEKKESFVKMIEGTRVLCLPGFRVTLSA